MTKELSQNSDPAVGSTRLVRHWWAIIPRGGWPAFVSPTKPTTKRLFMRAIAELGDTSDFEPAMKRNGNRLVCMTEVPNAAGERLPAKDV